MVLRLCPPCLSAAQEESMRQGTQCLRAGTALHSRGVGCTRAAVYSGLQPIMSRMNSNNITRRLPTPPLHTVAVNIDQSS